MVTTGVRNFRVQPGAEAHVVFVCLRPWSEALRAELAAGRQAYRRSLANDGFRVYAHVLCPEA